MMRWLCAAALVLVLAGCEGTSVRGEASERGLHNIKVGVPF